jgi:hypothetical protein
MVCILKMTDCRKKRFSIANIGLPAARLSSLKNVSRHFSFASGYG